MNTKPVKHFFNMFYLLNRVCLKRCQTIASTV
jgi:hypothetical protein